MELVCSTRSTLISRPTTPYRPARPPPPDTTTTSRKHPTPLLTSLRLLVGAELRCVSWRAANPTNLANSHTRKPTVRTVYYTLFSIIYELVYYFKTAKYSETEHKMVFTQFFLHLKSTTFRKHCSLCELERARTDLSALLWQLLATMLACQAGSDLKRISASNFCRIVHRRPHSCSYRRVD